MTWPNRSGATGMATPALSSARVAGCRGAAQRAPQRLGRRRFEPRRNRSTPRPFLDPCRGASRGAGVRRRPILPLHCPATDAAASAPSHHDAAASAHESAPGRPGRGCDNTLRRAVYLPARHGSGTKEVPARRAFPHDAPLSTSHQPAHTTGTVAPGDSPFSPGRASVARHGTCPDPTTSVWLPYTVSCTPSSPRSSDLQHDTASDVTGRASA